MNRNHGSALVRIFICCVSVTMVLLFFGCQHLVGTKPDPVGQLPPDDSLKRPVYTGWEHAPVSKALTDWAVKNDTRMFVFVTMQGEVRISDINGNEIKPCGIIDGTEIKPYENNRCKELSGVTITNINDEVTLTTTGSPHCVTKKIDGYLIQVCN
ncbi:MAG: hypothetical protein HKM93_08450 [Desulfobacteraceae bacterium]|nr:hypothetical protein [Desulfobacteraceae bacterium]